jgi:hypothetical protein
MDEDKVPGFSDLLGSLGLMADENKTFEEKFQEWVMGIDATTPGHSYLQSYKDNKGWVLGSLKGFGDPHAQFPALQTNAAAIAPLTLKTATSLPQDQWGPFANYSLNKLTDLANQRIFIGKQKPSDLAYSLMYDDETKKQHTKQQKKDLQATAVQDFGNQAVTQAQNYMANPYRHSLYGMPLGILADEQAAEESGMTLAERVEENMIDFTPGEDWE